ncbi:MAG: DUF3037 domain-containing protein [Terriglobia bacterium]
MATGAIPKLNRSKPCNVFVVRYVADVVRNEALNIGVLLHCAEEKYMGCLFATDFRRVKRLDPHADLALLGALQEDFDRQIEEHENDLESYLAALSESLSNLIQLDGPLPCALLDPAAGIQHVYRRYVGLGTEQTQPEDARPRIKQRLTGALVDAGVWERLDKHVPAARWTHPGDPFTFDYGYRSARAISFLHALSLRRDTQLAKTLAYTLGYVRRQNDAALTVVVENASGTEDPAAQAARSILEEARISVRPVAQAGELARSVAAALEI